MVSTSTTCRSQRVKKNRKHLTQRSKKTQQPLRKQPLRSAKKLTSKIRNTEPIRRALLIGINYKGTNCELNGCINDSTNLSKFLIKENLFKSDEITIMTDDKKSTDLYPTKKNIWNQLRSLIQLANENPTNPVHLFWAYSGHGASIPDRNHDETDNFDEAICPIDYKKSGFIVDDEIYAKFISQLPANVKIVALSDACHSGTIFDLRYNYKCNSKKSCLTNNESADSQAQCVLISGCRDKQTSADAELPKNADQNGYQGAMTASFLASYKHMIPYSELITSMRSWISQKKFSQSIQLSSGQPIDVDNAFLLSTFKSN